MTGNDGASGDAGVRPAGPMLDGAAPKRFKVLELSRADFVALAATQRQKQASADDGMLTYDANGNGVVDGIHELFGSTSQDGFEVLETLDANHDGTIDAADAAYGQLRVWRDLDQDGVSDAGELQTLGEAGIASLALTRTNVTGTNAGHDRGFASTFTRTNGTIRSKAVPMFLEAVKWNGQKKVLQCA